MTYVMGFVAAVPEANKAAYTAFAEESVAYFKELGVTRMLEAWGDEVPKGKVTDFYRAVAAQDGETIVYSFQLFPDAATADRANEKMMNDPIMADMGAKMPFDGARMIYGGFDVISERIAEGDTGYVEGSVIAVPNAAREAYTELAARLAELFIENGAVRSTDAWGKQVPEGKITDFKKAVAAQDDEGIVLSWIEWPSRAVRDVAWPKLMQDPLLQHSAVGFDESRRIFGAFVPILDR